MATPKTGRARYVPPRAVSLGPARKLVRSGGTDNTNDGSSKVQY